MSIKLNFHILDRELFADRREIYIGQSPKKLKEETEMKNIETGTIIRTVVLVIALINMALTAFGKNPLPFSDDEVYSGVSALITVIASLVAWWKNNSFTTHAVEADDILKIKKAEGNTEDENVTESIAEGGEENEQ